MFKECSSCHDDYPLTEYRYFPVSERVSKQCRFCRMAGAEAQQKWRDENPETARERSHESARNYRLNYPELAARAQRLDRAKRTPAENKAYDRAVRERHFQKVKDSGKWDEHLQERREYQRKWLAKQKAKKPPKPKKTGTSASRYYAKLRNDPVRWAKKLERDSVSAKKRRAEGYVRPKN